MTVAENVTVSLNKFEKIKAEKDGLKVKVELEDFARIGWESINESDRDYRLKWLGIFFRPVTPGKFMMRLRIPSGILTSSQMRVLAEIVQRYGDDGNADITTRQNLQLRGIKIEDIPDIFNRLHQVGLTSVQSGMDNVRNITGSPVSGIDANELIDTRGLIRKLQDAITNNGEGNPEFTNLPRKFNIAIEGGRDNSVHAEINDIAFVPAYKNAELGFNVVVGGFFSAKRCEAAIPLNAWVPANDDVIKLSLAILILYRNFGLRANRQKSRLMWLIDEWGMEKFRAEVEKQFAHPLLTAAPKDEIDWEKRDHLGIYQQKQLGFNYVGLHVPVGRFYASDMFDLARLADVYGSGEIRLTVEQNVIIPNIPDSRLKQFLKESLLQRFSINPSTLSRTLVSCTGAQFCNFALIETKNRAVALIKELDRELALPKSVRIHWTGCPNSCGQPQVADIGLMGTKARKNGKAVEGVDLYMGGKVGKDAHLGTCVQKGIPCEDLKPILRDLLIEKFGAKTQENPPEESLANAGLILEYEDTNNTVSATTNGHKTVENPVKSATVVLAQAGKEIICTEEDLILDIAEKAGADIPSSCRSGNCGTCATKLIEGVVNYDSNPDGLTEGDRAENLILTCIAHPVGKIVLDA